MKNIAFIRSLEIEKASPYLNAIGGFAGDRGLRLKLFYTDGTCDPGFFCGETEKIERGISCEDLVRRVAGWRPDAVVSISLPDDNAFRDACVKDALEREHGIPMIMHPMEATAVMANKWMTKEMLKSAGLATPEGVYVDGDQLHGRGIQYAAYRDYLLRRAREMGYPVLVKAIWDSLSADTLVFDDEAALSAYLGGSMNKNFILEKFVHGRQCMLEFLAHEGRVYFQPMIAQCVPSVQSFIPFHHFRCAPALGDANGVARLREGLTDIARRLGLCGAVNADLIFSGGEFYVLELNPRVSGITTLSISSSGVNTYRCLVEMALHEWRPGNCGGDRERFSIEFPVQLRDKANSKEIEAAPEVLFVRDFVFQNGAGSTDGSIMHLRCRDALHCRDVVGDLQRRYGLIEASRVAELEQALLAC